MGDKVYLRDLDFSSGNCHSIVEVEIFGTGKSAAFILPIRLFGTRKT